MLSPLKPLLCRHDFYWSERHGCDRCRRCGKRREAEAMEFLPPAAPAPAPRPEEAGFGSLSARAPKLPPRGRRERLLELLDRLARTERPSREEAIDAVLAVIEDAHSAEPVLFGQEAADHFARLHRARWPAAAA